MQVLGRLGHCGEFSRGSSSLINFTLPQEGSCIMVGISRNPSTGLIDRCFNMNLLHYESTPAFSGLVESFNVSTNEWAYTYVFKRLRFLNNKILSQTLTLGFLALWHGFATGYYNTFGLEVMEMKLEKDVSFCTRFDV